MPTNSLRPLRWLWPGAGCAETISAPALAKTPALVVIGDSLSAGYGMRAEQGWVHLLSERLREQAAPYQVVNASISGDTSRGGSARLGILLRNSTSPSQLWNWAATTGCAASTWRKLANT